MPISKADFDKIGKNKGGAVKSGSVNNQNAKAKKETQSLKKLNQKKK